MVNLTNYVCMLLELRLGPIIIGIHSSSKRVDKSAPALWGLNLDHTLMYDWDG